MQFSLLNPETVFKVLGTQLQMVLYRLYGHFKYIMLWVLHGFTLSRSVGKKRQNRDRPRHGRMFPRLALLGTCGIGIFDPKVGASAVASRCWLISTSRQQSVPNNGMSIFPAKEVKREMSYCKCSKSHTTARRIISISKEFLLCGLICLRRFVDFQSQPQIASEASMHLELLQWLSGPGHCTPCSALASSHLFPQWQPLPPWLGTCREDVRVWQMCWRLGMCNVTCDANDTFMD